MYREWSEFIVRFHSSCRLLSLLIYIFLVFRSRYLIETLFPSPFHKFKSSFPHRGNLRNYPFTAYNIPARTKPFHRPLLTLTFPRILPGNNHATTNTVRASSSPPFYQPPPRRWPTKSERWPTRPGSGYRGKVVAASSSIRARPGPLSPCTMTWYMTRAAIIIVEWHSKPLEQRCSGHEEGSKPLAKDSLSALFIRIIWPLDNLWPCNLSTDDGAR